MQQILPTQYHIEVYENTFVSDPIWGTQSSTPLPAIAIGDGFEHRGIDAAWYNPPSEGYSFRVKDIQHIFWVIEKSHLGHKLMVCLESVEINK